MFGRKKNVVYILQYEIGIHLRHAMLREYRTFRDALHQFNMLSKATKAKAYHNLKIYKITTKKGKKTTELMIESVKEKQKDEYDEYYYSRY